MLKKLRTPKYRHVDITERMQSNRSTKLCTATVDYSFYVRGTPNPGCDFPASTRPKNKEKRYDIIIFNEYDESNTRASHIDMGIHLTTTSCPALSSIRPSASLESLQTWFFRTHWRGRKWFLNFLLGEPNHLSEHLSHHVTNLSVKSSRRCSYRAQTIGCDWGRNDCHFRYRHEGRVVVRSSHTRIRGHHSNIFPQAPRKEKCQ